MIRPIFPKVEDRLKGSLSVRFPSVLGDRERAQLSSSLTSHSARIASWSPHGIAGATYVRVDYDAESPAGTLRAMFPSARIDDPPLVILEVKTTDPAAPQRIVAALVGPAGPVGILAATATPCGAVVELDDTRTPLSVIVDVIDVETRLGTPGRTIRPLIGLRDRTLAGFAAAALATPGIDEACFIETYSERLLQGEAS